MKKLILWICIGGMCSCQQNARLEQALELAGTNRPELEKVLTHYRDSGLKYDAALFLIENMPGCHGADSAALARLHPVYDAYDAINRASHYQADGKWGAPGVWGERIDSLEKKHVHLFDRLPAVMDLQHVKADYLIREIDRSFLAWQGNVYASGGSFEDFCDYVLPYRQQNGLVMDAVRDTFYQRHARDYYVREGKSWLEETDSLLYEYHHLTHSGFRWIPLTDMCVCIFGMTRYLWVKSVSILQTVVSLRSRFLRKSVRFLRMKTVQC